MSKNIPIDLLENKEENIYEVTCVMIKRVNQLNNLFVTPSGFNKRQIVEEEIFDDILEEQPLDDEKIVSRSIREVLSEEIKYKPLDSFKKNE